MFRTEYLQFTAMLIPTLVLFVALSLLIVVPEAPATFHGPETQEFVYLDTEMVPVGTVLLR